MLRWISLLALFSWLSILASERVAKPPAAGPIYVPLDSWIYPALKRLAAMGYVPDEETLVAPWTRQQCLLFIQQAEDIASRHETKMLAATTNKIAYSLIADLRRELPDDVDVADELRLESVYSRFSQVFGSPLLDSYHFGQTFINDYGRPYDSGTNTVDGFSGYGTWGRFSGYLRGGNIRRRVGVHRTDSASGIC